MQVDTVVLIFMRGSSNRPWDRGGWERRTFPRFNSQPIATRGWPGNMDCAPCQTLGTVSRSSGTVDEIEKYASKSEAPSNTDGSWS